MEVFIRHLDPKVASDQVEEWLIPILKDVGIHVFRLHKNKNKPFATLIIPDAAKAALLIEKTGRLTNLPRHPHTRIPAFFSPSRNQPDTLEIKILRKQEKDFNSTGVHPRLGTKNGPGMHQKSIAKDLRVESIQCGRWEGQDGKRCFAPFLHLNKEAVLTKQRRSLVLNILGPQPGSLSDLTFDHEFLESMLLSRVGNQYCLFLTLYCAPRLCNHPPRAKESPLALHALFKELIPLEDKPQRTRSTKLSADDDRIAGTCLVYRLNFKIGTWKDDLTRAIQHLSSGWFLLMKEDQCLVRQPSMSFNTQIRTLEHAVNLLQWSYQVRYQIQALWTNAILSPSEVHGLLPNLRVIRNRTSSDHDLLVALRYLTTQLSMTGPQTQPVETGMQKALSILSQKISTMQTNDKYKSDDEISIHRVTITPTGVYLYGPNKETANRVLRQFKGFEDYFLRVSFTDEDAEKLQFDSQASNEEVLKGRFLSILRNGLSIAGEKFEFLGFSHSSLRSQTCWFMRPLAQGCTVFTAQSVIKSLGNFSSIQCPAKCAARIGQAFSDTEKAVSVEEDEVSQLPDITSPCQKFTFTDGCGTISKSLCNAMKKGSQWSGQPTVFQIRYRGAKGVVSLDTRLKGRQLCLRPSMIKFEGSPSKDIEVCGTNSRLMPCRTNRPLIKILEDLGVSHEAFHVLQASAVDHLRRSAQSATSATDFLLSNFFGNATNLAPLISCLCKAGIDVTEDEFIRSIIKSLIEVQLRDLKFRSRILINRAVTLYGICDETGFLQEGQVYATFEVAGNRHSHHEGRIAVTRSPALHPGDVQLVTAVGAPTDSPLRDLTNCIVFSSKGLRDVPSMLGGGDLDGDIFNVIYDDDLIPQRCEKAADYTPAQAINIGRPVTSSDITEFFVNFMENDQLGRIATNHLIFADQADQGVRSQNCLKLATLHSTAVDFSKTGRPVHWKNVPQPKPYRPDFMAPSASTRIEKNKQIAADSAGDEYVRFTYYESERILGKLFRAINEDEFFDTLEDDNDSIFGRSGSDTVLNQIWSSVGDALINESWKIYLDMAQEVKDYYCAMVLDAMSQYAIGYTRALTEREVIIGTIIGRSGFGGKRQREQSELMKVHYRRELQEIRQWMRDQTEEDPDGYLLLAVACLSLDVGDSPVVKTPAGDHLKSFAWFAAAICVPMLV